MCGFIAQLVEHRTGITEVTGLNPVEASCVKGPCNVQKSSELDIKKTNLVALMTSIAARTRNPTMSAAPYHISAVFFHSGIKHEDL